jgi:predicted nucleic acid-binding protein
MQQGQVVDLDSEIALTAAGISLKHNLPLADSVMLATAGEYKATFWTQDSHFEGMAGVEYRKVLKKNR